MLERDAVFRLLNYFMSEFLFVVNIEVSGDGKAINILKFEFIHA
jgi:hypothetical protein